MAATPGTARSPSGGGWFVVAHPMARSPERARSLRPGKARWSTSARRLGAGRVSPAQPSPRPRRSSGPRGIPRRSPRRHRRPPPPPAPIAARARATGSPCASSSTPTAPRRRAAGAVIAVGHMSPAPPPPAPRTTATSASRCRGYVRPRVDHRHLTLAGDLRSGPGEVIGPCSAPSPPAAGASASATPIGDMAADRTGRAMRSFLARVRTAARNPVAHGLPPGSSVLPRSLFGRALAILWFDRWCFSSRWSGCHLLQAPLPARRRADDPQHRLQLDLRGRPARRRRRRPAARAALAESPALAARSLACGSIRATLSPASTATSSTSPARPSSDLQRQWPRAAAHRPRTYHTDALILDPAPASACSAPPVPRDRLSVSRPAPAPGADGAGALRARPPSTILFLRNRCADWPREPPRPSARAGSALPPHGAAEVPRRPPP